MFGTERISLIQFLVALLMHTLTGWSVPLCILLGGAVTAYYTIVGGLEAVIWTDVVQSVLLTGGEALANQASFNMIPGFLLLDKDLTVLFDSTGHSPRHGLWQDLLPAAKELLSGRAVKPGR